MQTGGHWEVNGPRVERNKIPGERHQISGEEIRGRWDASRYNKERENNGGGGG